MVTDHRLTRRTVLRSTGALALGGTLLAAEGTAQSEEFVLEQGEDCVPVTPLTGSEPVSDFYDWDRLDTYYSSAGTTALQREDTSVLFLYREPSGKVYLVVVHGKHTQGAADPDSGGSATFRFANLPKRGDWIVRDDQYEGDSNFDVWNLDQSPQEISWTWAGKRTDGGVFGPLGDSFDLAIDPAFNGDAALAGQYYDGRVTDWQVLSGDLSDPDRRSLSLGETVRLRTGRCRKPPVAGTPRVEVPQGRVNPRNHGVLAVDFRATDQFPIEALDLSSVRAMPGEVEPIERVPLEDGIRLFFPTQALTFDGAPEATLRFGARTRGGRSVTVTATVALTPPQSRDDEPDRDRNRDEEDDHRPDPAEERGRGPPGDDEDDGEDEEDDDRGRDRDEDDDHHGPPGRGRND